MTIIALVRTTTAQVRTLAECMKWTELTANEIGALCWQPQAMDARITWHVLDESFGEFSFEGEHSEIAMADVGQIFNLLDDVDVMTEIGNAATPGELAVWAKRLGAFAAGDVVYAATLDVFKGLLASERREFVAAAVQGLCRARWGELADPLKQASDRWPEMEADCQRALASIQRGKTHKA